MSGATQGEPGGQRPTAPYAYGGRHSTLSQTYVGAFLECPSFTAADKQVACWYLTQSTGHGEPVEETQARIAERLGLNAKALQKIVAKLTAHRILGARGSVGRTRFYAVNPFLGGHGPGRQQREVIKAWRPPVIPGFCNGDVDPGAAPVPEDVAAPTIRPMEHRESA
ncbi:MarR family transcriptional regulator [Streptomyces sp. NPDC089919]|uniref:MarR family transcriptional regulator n=1 Tax=Streptomyces sp. NPDC089919 TaxID=3155188 RepID=UPI00344150C8